MPTDDGREERELPTGARGAIRLSARLSGYDRWAGAILAHQRTLVALDFGSRLEARLSLRQTVQDWAAALAQRFVASESAHAADDLPVTPYAPPLRQLSSSRQGAAAWGDSGGASGSSSGRSMTGEELLRDLESRGLL
jgi:hypothetical protein